MTTKTYRDFRNDLPQGSESHVGILIGAGGVGRVVHRLHGGGVLMDSEHGKILNFEHPTVAVGSDKWNDEIMDGINELIERCASLEKWLHLEWSRTKRTHTEPTVQGWKP